MGGKIDATLIYNLHVQLNQTFDQHAFRGRLNPLAYKYCM